PLRTHIRVGRKAKAERVPVRLAAKVTEVGTVEVWCHSRTDDRRWRLQIQLRGAPTEPRPALPILDADADAVVIEQSELDAGIAAIRAAFSGAGVPGEQGPARLVKRLEECLDAPRDSWPPSALRALWEPLRDLVDVRNKSPQHESRWFNLAGYVLRPGVGFPLDESRIKALWSVFHQGVKHVKDAQCWAEWWIVWRRVAAGLNKAHHEEIHRRLAPLLFPPKGGPPRKGGRPKPEPHELAEIWRCAASLERLATSVKEPLGDALVKDVSRPTLAGHVLWSLGRVGARVPLFGPANTVVGRDKAERWTKALLDREFAQGRETTDAVFALSQLARVSGDRARDLDEDLRARVIERLEALGADEEAIRPVREFTELEAAQQGQALGDSLPVGLRLRSSVESETGA
ncbi:MAG TPA: molecular chaperone DnaK, partial [Isosphaeraceae bacterium]